jgi:hypothetical protein
VRTIKEYKFARADFRRPPASRGVSPAYLARIMED